VQYQHLRADDDLTAGSGISRTFGKGGAEPDS
jgi:hypothetical protein